MKKSLLNLCALTLALGMLLSLGACAKKNQEAEQNTTGKESFKPADEFGITTYGLIPESAFPNHEELEDWYEQSKERSSLVYAVFYAKDAERDVWYCWMYAEGFTFADTASLTVDDTNGTKVHIDLTVQSDEVSPIGAYCFAIPSAVEPTFAMTVNGAPEGLIVTLSQNAAIPLS